MSLRLHLLHMLLIENLLNRQEFDEASCSLVKRSAFAGSVAAPRLSGRS